MSFEKLELQIMVKTQGFFAGGQTLGIFKIAFVYDQLSKLQLISQV